jgi:acetoin utilization deacetylase AcuC-like enzyme
MVTADAFGAGGIDVLARAKALIDQAEPLHGLAVFPTRTATSDELQLVHTALYLTTLAETSVLPPDVSQSWTIIDNDAYRRAELAAGAALVAVDAVAAGEVIRCYSLGSSPGHHASAASASGFCILSNVAIAARYAQTRHNLGRVAVLDWDVHHGNGTQEVFYEDSSVLTISVHQDSLYPPCSGLLDEAGKGAGEGFNINVPLPAGCGVGAYMAVMENIAVPAISLFKPDVILVACGVDAGGMDPFGRQLLSSSGFAELTRSVRELADRICQGRMVLVHEGGYSRDAGPYAVLAIVEELCAVAARSQDPFAGRLDRLPDQSLSARQDERIRTSANAVLRLREAMNAQ